MKIALFRYHDNVDVCKNHLRLFRLFNPDILIYGLYGGNPERFDFFSQQLNELTGNYCLQFIDARDKWLSFDYALKEWYQSAGRFIDFTQLYVIEWDFMLFEKIDVLYAGIPEGSVGLSGLTHLDKIESKWYWTKNENKRQEWLTLMQYVKDKYHYNAKPYGALCPGLTVSRSFLDTFLDIELPSLGNDELRFPLYVQIIGHEMADTRFYKKWFSRREGKYFNCNNLDIKQNTINRQLSKGRGRRVFHPVREILDQTKVPILGDFLKNIEGQTDIIL